MKRKNNKVVLILIGTALMVLIILTMSLTTNAKENEVLLPCIGLDCIIKGQDLNVSYDYSMDEFSPEELVMLQKIALAEAEGEGSLGMAYVMQTVINRKNDENFPDTIEGVIFENKNGTWQFSSVLSGRYDRCEPNESSSEALELLCCMKNTEVLYFENPGSKDTTWHSRNLNFVFEYQNHKFYN